jgi:hypothetical protein
MTRLTVVDKRPTPLVSGLSSQSFEATNDQDIGKSKIDNHPGS